MAWLVRRLLRVLRVPRVLLGSRPLRWAVVAAIAVAMFLPGSWLRTGPVGDPTGVDTAVIFGFGFERDSAGTMQPGAANSFLLRHTLDAYPEVTTIFAQEGVWAAACPVTAQDCEIEGRTLRRIDRHRDGLDLHTLDIAACTIERMLAFGHDQAIVVAHDLQLGRAAENLARVKDAGLCPDCSFVIADVPDVPYPRRTEQLRTRSEFLYRFVELAARVRFSALLVGDPPQTCPSPM